jgi:ABC-type lipoprotein export system ATPase subunit
MPSNGNKLINSFMSLLKIKNLKAAYRRPQGDSITVLNIPEFEIQEAEQIALKGRSGSGKTTFLNVISGILSPYEGSVVLAGKELKDLSESQRDVFRGEHIGFIFQTFHLLDGFTALENVVLGSVFAGNPEEETSSVKDRALKLLKQVGLDHRENHLPRMMSSGEQQRVAIARALINKPRIILADEPTGSLDEKNSSEVLELIRNLSSESKAALLLVTHDPSVMERFKKVVDLKQLQTDEQK